MKKNSHDLLRFLFGETQTDLGMANALDDLFEKLADVEGFESRKTPLETALKKLGVKDGEVTVEGDGLTLNFSCPEAYSAAKSTLISPCGMHDLAVEGWAVLDGGDKHMDGDTPLYTLKFIDVAPCETSDGEAISNEKFDKLAGQAQELSNQTIEQHAFNKDHEGKPPEIKHTDSGAKGKLKEGMTAQQLANQLLDLDDHSK